MDAVALPPTLHGPSPHVSLSSGILEVVSWNHTPIRAWARGAPFHRCPDRTHYLHSQVFDYLCLKFFLPSFFACLSSHGNFVIESACSFDSTHQESAFTYQRGIISPSKSWPYLRSIMLMSPHFELSKGSANDTGKGSSKNFSSFKTGTRTRY